jgi:hypothetical protein
MSISVEPAILGAVAASVMISALVASLPIALRAEDGAHLVEDLRAVFGSVRNAAYPVSFRQRQ